MTSFIDIYKNKVSDFTDTPIIYIEASALHLLSALFSRFYSIPCLPSRAKPNIYIIMSSICGATRRSTVSSFDYPIYKNVYLYYLNKIKNIRVDEDKLDELASDSYIEEGTPEGITDSIISYRKKYLNLKLREGYSIKYNYLLNVDFQSTEFGDVLKAMSSKGDYRHGMARLVSKFYYGEGGKVNLSSRGGKNSIRYIPSGIYATMFAGMQTADLYIDKYHVQQGLLRRCILTESLPERWLPLLDNSRFSHTTDIDELSKLLKEKLNFILGRFNKLPSEDYTIPIGVSENVQKKINNIDHQRWKDVKADPKDNYALFRQSEGEIKTKLCCLFAIDDDVTLVELRHFEKAEKFFDIATKNNKKIIDKIGMIKVPIKTDEELRTRIKQIIKNAGTEGCLYSKIEQTISPADRNQLENCINSMVASSEIKMSITRGPGRPGRRYHISRTKSKP